jgi:hypothetical protein
VTCEKLRLKIDALDHFPSPNRVVVVGQAVKAHEILASEQSEVSADVFDQPADRNDIGVAIVNQSADRQNLSGDIAIEARGKSMVIYGCNRAGDALQW